MKFATLLAVTAALTVFATAGHAADAVIYDPAPPAAAPVVAQAYDWSGFYLGAHGGYVSTTAEALGEDEDFNGGLVGAHAGINFQSGNIVYGIEGDVNHTFNENEYVIGGVTAEAGTEWQASVRARLGFALDRTLVYATGGVAFTDAYAQASAGGVTLEVDDNFTGYTVGGGLEHAINDEWNIRGEYRYSDFGDGDFDIPGAEIDLTQHQVTVGVSFKF
jgi:outer membrane immunogenic protein